ncbi:peptidyl-tRNA hydrolase ICT1, mitochondrial-like [Eublepharis macularius]|uniref:Large ribosomal subunit protein mL62 n=1 Tax=Eublepharis macularius TaxID=481883 RepID=A0AA97JJ01_EUBMA|nr:peptidyl-tRNA hydrolase ICT1, mitochondrial-like [Eublepharis macularius]
MAVTGSVLASVPRWRRALCAAFGEAGHRKGWLYWHVGKSHSGPSPSRLPALISAANTVWINKKNVPDIPVDRLSISYCRSSGPGGQNVNKVNTKAEIRFLLASADWIAEDVRQKMAVMHKNKISKSGELIITSEVSRYQMRNLADCLLKLRDLIAEATEKPQVVSKLDVQIIRDRVEKMNRERLHQKKIHSALKQSRHVDFD